MSWIGVGVLAVGATVKIVSGAKQKKSGNKILDSIGDKATEEVPGEVLENQRLARARANEGLPAEQYQQAMKNLQRQQVLQLRNAHTRRGGLGVVAGGQSSYNDALLNLDVANAKARMQNERTLYGVNNNVAGWKDKVWSNNVRDVWNRKYQYGMSLVGKGNKNISSGIDQGISAAGSAAGAIGGSGSSSGSYEPNLNDISGMQRMPYNPQTQPY